MIARLAARLTRDKADTLLLLLVSVLVLAPHFRHLPLWASATITLTLCWRGAITLRGSRLPPLWLLLPVSLLAMGGVYLSFRTLLGREPGVAMLALLLTFKLLEMHARRDLFVVIFLSFFLLLTNFFYSQTILTALGMVGTLVLLLTAQLTYQFTGAVPPLAARLRLAARIFLTAAPLAAFLFVAFPRIQGPLWGMPGDANGGRSGISDSMSPGSMSKLALSEEVAFRVRFEGKAPMQQQLYWRGPVLSAYDGRTWTRHGRLLSSRERQAFSQQMNLAPPALPYQVTLEPGNQKFLFLLEMSHPDFSTEGSRAGYSDEMEGVFLYPSEQRQRYRARGHTVNLLQPQLAAGRMDRWLALPAGFNPRTLAYAERLNTLRAERGDDAAIADILRLFRNGFEYTLEPTLLGRDAVDEFLFETRQGFCEHYASAFVYLLRGAGLPARVVTGYQGGELNPVDGFYTIRQSDAHAWAEAWLGPARGWVRFDPTAAVAPERIRSSLAQALPEAAPFGLQGLVGLGRDKDSWLGKLRFGINAMNNAWNQWILDYNPNRQQHFLRELGDSFANWRMLAALAACGALLGLMRYARGRQRDPVEAAFQAFCRVLARHGVVRAPDDGPLTLAQRVQGLDLPREKVAAMTGFLQLYGAIKYGAATPDKPVARLNSLLKQSQ